MDGPPASVIGWNLPWCPRLLHLGAPNLVKVHGSLAISPHGFLRISSRTLSKRFDQGLSRNIREYQGLYGSIKDESQRKNRVGYHNRSKETLLNENKI
jgi:hypothetical protein